jgi:hypothetical protein
MTNELIGPADFRLEGPGPEGSGLEGLQYRAAFLTAAEETDLLRLFAALPFEEAQYKEWRAKRRIVSYG